MDDYAVVGKPVVRVDALEKITGNAIYGTDIKIPGMLYGKIFRSTCAHGKLVRVDTSKAERVKGVRAVVTGKEFPITHGSAWIKDQPFLAIDKVRYIGEPVAAVAAIDEDTAEEAAQLIQAEYEELPAVFDPLEAMEPGAPLVHENLAQYAHAEAFHPLAGTNICNYFKVRLGNLEEGLREADYVLEDRYSTPMVQHCPMEPHAAVAQIDASGKITVWTTTCSPFVTRGELARALQIPMTKIRIIPTWVGGAFGSKQGPKLEGYCIALSQKAHGRAVKITHSRSEEFACSLARTACISQFRTGVQKTGKICAVEVKLIWETGAYSSHSPAVSRNAGFSAAGPYKIPHIKIDSYCVYTNNPIMGAMRGFGIPEVAWGLESHLDMIAAKLALDPLEFRLLNVVEEGTTYATGERLHSVGLRECLEKAAARIGWQDPPVGKFTGKGIACMHKSTGTPSSSAAIVKLNEDGSAVVLTSAGEIGQGVATILAQIASEELGVDMERLQVSRPDTDLTPFERSTSSSRNTFHTGNAVKMAARDAREQILAIASQVFHVPPADLEIRRSKVFVRQEPEKSISLEKLWRAGIYSQQQLPIVGKGIYSTAEVYDPVDPETGRSKSPSVFWMYGAQAAEVEVDIETGRVNVKRVVAAHDVGKAINPQGCEQQIEGSIANGWSIAILEELKAEKGKVLNDSFADYKIATALDVPRIEPIIVEAKHDLGPFGAKGLGEPAFAPTAPAIANAIYAAVGVRIKDLPITPEKLLRCLQQKKEGSAG